MTAIPLRSELELAAVGEAFGTVSVLVSMMLILDVGIFSTRLATYINIHAMNVLLLFNRMTLLHHL